MTRDDIKAAMQDAGLFYPRVMPLRLRDGSAVFVLEAGRFDLRKSVRVAAEIGKPTTAETDAVDAGIEDLKALLPS